MEQPEVVTPLNETTPLPVKRSLLAPFNRAGAPRIADLGFDAQAESGDNKDSVAINHAADVIGVPGERIGHISFGFEGERWRIRNIIWVVGQSTTGLALIDQTYRAGYRIGFDSMVSTGEQLQSFTNTQDKIISLDPRASSEQLVAMLILQLALASAAIDGLFYDSSFTPPAALAAHRMTMAYAHGLQLQVAYELRTATAIPDKSSREVYWRILSKELSRLSSGFAQMAVNELSITQGSAIAGAVREFYAHASLRQHYEAEVINYYRSLPAAILKDPKAMTASFDPAQVVYKLKFPGMLYAMTHEPRIDFANPKTSGAAQSTVDAVAAMQQARKAAGIKDRDAWQIQVATL